MILSAENLSLRRGGQRVLENVSLELQPGTITAIVGPNGAGKSSLLLGLAGLLEPEAGEVALDRNSIGDMTGIERARLIGYLPQNADIAWDVAVANLVALGRLPHRDRGHEAIEAAIEALSIGHLRDRPASQLSGGERARVLLARVLAGEPRWILADEPLAALDLAHQFNLVAHLKLAMNNADRVIVLHEGRKLADGSPREALSEDVIASGWGIRTRWIGEPGRHALAVQP